MAKADTMIRGRVGNMIFYEVNGETRVRAAPMEYRDANSTEQQMVRRRLVVAVRFYQSLKETRLRAIWQVAARGKASNGYTCFLRENIHVFNERTIGDPSRLKLAEGCLPGMCNLRVAGWTGNRVTLAWENSLSVLAAHAENRLRVILLTERRMYSPVWLEGVEASRGDGKVEIVLGENLQGMIHLYCFFEDGRNGVFSPSAYVGFDWGGGL